MNARNARVAGSLYAAAIVIGWFSLLYVPSRIIKHGDAVATAHAIAANEFLFRLGMVGELVGGIVWLFVVLALYRLLAGVDRTQAVLMVILGALLQVPFYFFNVVNYAAALLFVSDTSFLSVFSSAQRDAMAMLFVRLHYYEFLASFMFAGLWLFPFGALVYASRCIPRILGIWLILNGVAYLTICISGFLTPQFSDTVDTITRPVRFGELAIVLWLLIAPRSRFYIPV